jgi:hypothetical protein
MHFNQQLANSIPWVCVIWYIMKAYIFYCELFYLVFAQFLLRFYSVFAQFFYCELMPIVIIITVYYCELFLLSFCLVFYCELMLIVINITVNYCELFLLRFCKDILWACSYTLSNNGGKAHIFTMSYFYSVWGHFVLLWTAMVERHMLCLLCVCCWHVVDILCWKGTYFVLFCELLQVLENECLLLPKCWFIFVSVRNGHS